MVEDAYTGIRLYPWLNISMIHARDSNTGIIEVQIYYHNGRHDLLRLDLLKHKHPILW